jgi:hypothetical protein
MGEGGSQGNLGHQTANSKIIEDWLWSVEWL